ncbi:MAG: hypothetical protein QF773_02725 [Lentisphaeria bacterium]|nr:hypothetical protein [Lentisphaeria bacterium]
MSRMFRLQMSSCGFSLAFLLLFLTPLSSPAEKQWLHGAIRINSNISSGNRSMAQIADEATAAELDFIVFTDQLVARAEYGIWPLRHVVRYAREQPSIVTFGFERYLEQVHEAAAQNPDLVIIAGADVAPIYTWSGMPFTENFTVHQWSEQMTVFGPDSASFYRNLPALGNEAHGFFMPGTLLKLLPLLLLIPGISMYRRSCSSYTDTRGNRIRIRDWPRVLAGIVLVAGGVLGTFELRPFTQSVGFDQYGNYGTKPFAQVIDHAHSNDALCFWSGPEQRMEQVLSGVHFLTVPQLDDIRFTFRHNGLAGIYPDNSTAYRPGHLWDYMLLEYADGRRKVRPVAIGEVDYHGLWRVDGIQTIVHAEPNHDAVLQAIAAGRSYAANITVLDRVRLTQFEVSDAAGTTAGLGETLTTDARAVTVRIAGTRAPDKMEFAALFKLVVDGEAVAALPAPAEEAFEIVYDVELTRDASMHYVRLYMGDPAVIFISNPVFIQRPANADAP